MLVAHYSRFGAYDELGHVVVLRVEEGRHEFTSVALYLQLRIAPPETPAPLPLGRAPRSILGLPGE